MQDNGTVLVLRVCSIAIAIATASCGSSARPRPASSRAQQVPIPIVIAEVTPEPEPEWVKHDPPPKPPPPVDPSAQNKPYEPKTGEQSVKRETLNGHKKPPTAATLAEEVIVRLMNVGQQGFVRCFKKAADGSTLSYKIRLRVELDAGGVITLANTDANDQALDSCLVRVARGLPYPVPGKDVVVELPLFYRAE